MNELDATRYLRKKTGLYLYIGHEMIHATFDGKPYTGTTFIELVRDLRRSDPKAEVMDIEKAKP